jgi:hypothetical protein
MIRSVPLERLPGDFRFPEELAAKIKFDAARQQLQFEGFMSKTDFDKLVRLHNDLAYQRALEHLFQVSTFVPTKKPSRLGQVSLIFTGIAALLAVTMLAFFLRH